MILLTNGHHFVQLNKVAGELLNLACHYDSLQLLRRRPAYHSFILEAIEKCYHRNFP